jgi:hypothetical protein
MAGSPEELLSVAEQQRVIQDLSRVLQESYLYPAKAEEMSHSLARFATEALDQPLDAHELASRLTKQLYELSRDLHFFVEVDPEWIAQKRLEDDPESARQLRQTELRQAQRQNFSLQEVRLLEGNVGYLNLTAFGEPEHGSKTLASAMSFLAHCDSYIVDLRNNNGGYLEMAQLLASYFFAGDAEQMLFDYYYFEDGERIERQQWVLPSVPGEKRPEAPLYILVSSTSFSAAEWFAFVLGEVGRATVVGEVTAGGAHPVDRKIVDDRFVVNVPIGQIRGPGGEEDFEGEGIQPQVSVSAAEALNVAHRLAVEELMARRPEAVAEYRWLLPVLEARRRPVELDPQRLAALTGEYGDRRLSTEDGVLYYSWDGKTKIRLTPLSESLLALEGVQDFRFRVVEEGGEVVALERIHSDGRTSSRRNKTSTESPSAHAG